ncbi:MAG: thioredoxin family protein [Elusimicrobiota bacterium]|jgi:tetratricopeptide (TPR) repeat protein
MRKNIVFLLLLAWPLAGLLPAHGQPLENQRFEEVLRAAKAQGKPILLEFYTTWCPPCREMERSVLPDAGVQKALSSFVFARYDNDSEPGWSLNRRFNIRNFPTFIYLDVFGREKDRRLGSYDSTAEMIAALGTALQSAPSSAQESSDPKVLLKELRRASERGEEKAVISLLEKIKILDPKNEKDALAPALYSYAELLRGQRRFSEAAKLQMDLSERFPGSSSAESSAYMVEYTLRLAALDKAAAFYRKQIAAHPKRALDYAYFAEMCATHRFRLAEGFSMIRKALEIEPKSAEHYATLARLYYRKDDLASTVEAMKKAVELDPKEKTYSERLVRYQAELSAVEAQPK